MAKLKLLGVVHPETKKLLNIENNKNLYFCDYSTKNISIGTEFENGMIVSEVYDHMGNKMEFIEQGWQTLVTFDMPEGTGIDICIGLAKLKVQHSFAENDFSFTIKTKKDMAKKKAKFVGDKMVIKLRMTKKGLRLTTDSNLDLMGSLGLIEMAKAQMVSDCLEK